MILRPHAMFDVGDVYLWHIAMCAYVAVGSVQSSAKERCTV